MLGGIHPAHRPQSAPSGSSRHCGRNSERSVQIKVCGQASTGEGQRTIAGGTTSCSNREGSISQLNKPIVTTSCTSSARATITGRAGKGIILRVKHSSGNSHVALTQPRRGNTFCHCHFCIITRIHKTRHSGGGEDAENHDDRDEFDHGEAIFLPSVQVHLHLLLCWCRNVVFGHSEKLYSQSRRCCPCISTLRAKLASGRRLSRNTLAPCGKKRQGQRRVVTYLPTPISTAWSRTSKVWRLPLVQELMRGFFAANARED